ncbi:MAG: hypothetical protein H7144_06205 [Burkholderiales bacterium]|nr:hypothetical protein [Phycisphaerae bacterium]
MVDYWSIPVAILIILLASSFMLARLLRRHTVGRERFGVWEWSINRRFARGPVGPVVLEGLDDIQQPLRSLEHFKSRDDQISIYKLHSISEHDTVRTWHILVRSLDGFSTPIALRPAGASSSLIDLMNLQLFPRLSSEVRFAVYGLRATDARALANGPARALLPPDIGLIRGADQLILDFTSRPFDPVEFNRMLAVADQVKAVV